MKKNTNNFFLNNEGETMKDNIYSKNIYFTEYLYINVFALIFIYQTNILFFHAFIPTFYI